MFLPDFVQPYGHWHKHEIVTYKTHVLCSAITLWTTYCCRFKGTQIRPQEKSKTGVSRPVKLMSTKSETFVI